MLTLWMAPASSQFHHARGQSYTNETASPTEVIIDNEWRGGCVDTGEIHMVVQSLLPLACPAGELRLMYKYRREEEKMKWFIRKENQLYPGQEKTGPRN